MLGPAPVRAGDTVPQNISVIQSAAGDSLALSGRVVYVDFWASWCVPCRESFPWMKSLKDRYGKRGLQIVTINVDKDPAAARAFLEKMGASLPVVYDGKGDLAKQYRLEVMPTSFIYGRDGTLRATHEGFHPKESAEREAFITTLLEEKAKQ
jgi:cytochrome c biogenesis protein CcmG/thiol:disulfide interchange protein DsbE